MVDTAHRSAPIPPREPPSATEALFGHRRREPEPSWAIDARRTRIKGAVLLVIGLAGVALIQSLTEWMGDPGGRMIVIGAVTLVGLGVLMLARLLVIDCDASPGMCVLGMAAAVAMGDLGQHALAFTLIPVLAWIGGLVICLGVLADLLDLEIQDAVLIVFVLTVVKLILRWTVFTN